MGSNFRLIDGECFVVIAHPISEKLLLLLLLLPPHATDSTDFD